MKRLIGKHAYSPFRLAALKAELNKNGIVVDDFQAHYEYIYETSAPLSAKDEKKLSELCQAQSHDTQKPYVWVTPRQGTYSSWGTKALDICHQVGLNTLTRLERVVAYDISPKPSQPEKLQAILMDRMTESWQTDLENFFAHETEKTYQTIPLLAKGMAALQEADKLLGLALSATEQDYLLSLYQELQRDPTDVELMMFAQANSEHCRHKIFKGEWTIDGQKQEKSLFEHIQNTYHHYSDNILSAYHDNAAVVRGLGKVRFYCAASGEYQLAKESVGFLIKVETHNHPTAIEPYAGAGTGQGGEIRDEGATGRGGKPKMGLVGFSVSNLNIPSLPQPWENPLQKPERIVSALEIMLKGPIGGAAFNNEFGRPNVVGYFRTLEMPTQGAQNNYTAWGYHKPIMIAGGLGNITETGVNKETFLAGSLLIVLGGPAMRIGLGGGAASSVASGQSSAELDYASVQRQNPEMQRRCQEVIDRCWAMGVENPILSIHDVGAGGLCNAVPEIANDADCGVHIDLRKIPVAQTGLNPLEIWCNESQERYVLAIAPESETLFSDICARERCPFAILGTITEDCKLIVQDGVFNNKPIHMNQSDLFARVPSLQLDVKTPKRAAKAIKADKYSLSETLSRVLQCPTVGDKSFLITIGDRTVTGLIARDQMVGPWQVPVADCAVSATSYQETTGEAMSMGERPLIAVTDPAASAQMAVMEAVLNMLGSDIKAISDIKLSCNWMAAGQDNDSLSGLYAAVKAVGDALCPSLNVTIPVGKDSLSMQTTWQDNKVTSPVSLVVSAFAPVHDIQKTVTPLLNTKKPGKIYFIDLANGHQRLGGSIFAQVTEQLAGDVPQVQRPAAVNDLLSILNKFRNSGHLWAYHDKSDGGLWATLCEMAFASQTGLKIDISQICKDPNQALAALVNEELGVVVQIATEAEKDFIEDIQNAKLAAYEIATLIDNSIAIQYQQETLFKASLRDLHSQWSATSHAMQKLRDNPECADAEYSLIQNGHKGLSQVLTPEYDFAPNPYISINTKPKVAILREQGVNGHQEMAAAFYQAGFTPVDVTMTDLLSKRKNLTDFHVLAACGGFSFGDVLGAGRGWANVILHHEELSREFARFFARDNTLTLGVCNGCQMLSQLKSLIPGANHWPLFIRNQSEQFEARLSAVEITPSASILLSDLVGMRLPIAVAHGEGQVDNLTPKAAKGVCLQYVNDSGQATQQYPYNPNGSESGATGFTSEDGRATIMMPHPERVFLPWQLSWHPDSWAKKAESPWMQLFHRARMFLA